MLYTRKLLALAGAATMALTAFGPTPASAADPPKPTVDHGLESGNSLQQVPDRPPEVVTWNVQHQLLWPKVETWAEQISTVNPEVIGLQEICDYEATGPSGLNLSRLLPDYHIEFGEADSDHAGCRLFGRPFGQALLSKNPLTDVVTVPYSSSAQVPDSQTRAYMAATTPTYQHPDGTIKRIDHIFIKGLTHELYAPHPADGEFEPAEGSDHRCSVDGCGDIRLTNLGLTMKLAITRSMASFVNGRNGSPRAGHLSRFRDSTHFSSQTPRGIGISG